MASLQLHGTAASMRCFGVVACFVLELTARAALCSLCSLRQPQPPAPVCAQADLIDLGADRDPHYRYVLVYIDHYTRHVWLRPLPTKEPLQVAREVRFSYLANLLCSRPGQLAGIQQWSVHLQLEEGSGWQCSMCASI